MIKMVVLDPTTSSGIAIFLLVGVVLLKYSGYKDKIAKGLGFAVASAMFFFLAAATDMGFWMMNELAQAQYALGILWQVIAWILLLLAAFMVTGELAKVK